MDLSRASTLTSWPGDLFSAKELVVVVTGGGTGIGLAITASLAATGAKTIYILGRREPILQEAASSINKTTSTASGSLSRSVVKPLVCDVSDPKSIQDAVSKISEGYVDVLINNAGVIGPDHKSANKANSIQELQKALMNESDGWQSTFAINTTAVALVSASFLPLLDAGNARRGWVSGKLSPGGPARERKANRDVDASDKRTSQIITVSSIAAHNRHITAGVAYSASKAGSTHIGKMLATLLAPYGIRSNIIEPGMYPSEMVSGPTEGFSFDAVPAGHKGEFDDIAGVVLYLVGRAGTYVNGNVQVADGGRLSIFPATY